MNAIKNNSCTLDGEVACPISLTVIIIIELLALSSAADLVLSHLTPAKEHLVQIVGSCQTSSAFTIIQTKTPGILVNFSSLQNRFSAPLCISFMVDVAPGNVQPFLMFYNSSFEELGTITLTRTNISVTVQESAATFLNLDTTGFHQWQLCFNSSSVELYHGCSLVDSQPFSSSAWDGVSHMTILREVFNGTTFPFLVSRHKDTCSIYIPCSLVDQERMLTIYV